VTVTNTSVVVVSPGSVTTVVRVVHAVEFGEMVLHVAYKLVRTEPGKVDTPLVVDVDSDREVSTTVEVSVGMDTHDV
jgi:hypothetical protein